VTAHRKEFIRGQEEGGSWTTHPYAKKGCAVPKNFLKACGRGDCTFVSPSGSNVAQGQKRREGSLQTRLKSKRIPHGDSACGKVWCNESSLEHKTTKTADPQLTVTSDKTKGWRAVARLGKEKTRP
jgi:hypothetical protein